MKRTGQFLAFVFLLLLASERTFADGKMFVSEEIPPDIPYQRALILYRDGVETLVLQSKYQMTRAGSSKSIGWVVPIPAIPEVAGIPADVAQTLFSSLDKQTRPIITHLIKAAYAVFLVVAVLSLLSLLWGLSSFLGLLQSPWLQRNRTRLIAYAMFGFACCFLATIYATLFSTLGAKTAHSVKIVAEHQAGVYDVRIVRSKDPSELCAWLNANSFHFSE
jgi:hypothetical protein